MIKSHKIIYFNFLFKNFYRILMNNLGLSQPPAPSPLASTGGIMELAKKYWWVLLIIVAVIIFLRKRKSQKKQKSREEEEDDDDE